MTTPKEALEQLRDYLRPKAKYKDGANYFMENEESRLLGIVNEALASFEGDAVERVARIIDPDLFERYDAMVASSPKANSGSWEEQIYQYQLSAARTKARAILATGLVPDEAAIRAAQQSDDAFDIEEMRRENADNVRTLDAIADYVGCPHDEELTVDHVRQHYMELENAAQRQGIEDAGRIANAQAYSAECEAAIRADEREKCASYRNALLWVFDRLSVTGGMNANEQRRTMREVGNILTGKASPAATYQPNDWDDSAAIRSGGAK